MLIQKHIIVPSVPRLSQQQHYWIIILLEYMNFEIVKHAPTVEKYFLDCQHIYCPVV